MQKRNDFMQKKLTVDKNRWYLLMIVAAILYVGYLFIYNVHWYGFHLGDAHWRWQECAYVLHRINPFKVMWEEVQPLESIGKLSAEGGTIPWAYVLGNLINPGFLPYEIARYYIIALNIVLPLLTWGLWANYLLKKDYVQSKRTAFLYAATIFAQTGWATGFQYGNQAGIVCCLIVLAMIALDEHEILGAVLLAIAMCKPQITAVFFIPLLFKKKYKVIAISAGIVVLSWWMASWLTGTPMLNLVLNMLGQGLGYGDKYYYGLFNPLKYLGVSTSVILLLNIVVFGIVSLAIEFFRKKHGIDIDLFAYYAIFSLISVMWFYKQEHDYIVLAIAGVYLLCKSKNVIINTVFYIGEMMQMLYLVTWKLWFARFQSFKGLGVWGAFMVARFVEAMVLLLFVVYLFRCMNEKEKKVTG